MKINRSTYYKHFKETQTNKSLENQQIKTNILTIYSSSKKRLGAYKIRQLLLVEHGQKVSVGKVYRLLKSMVLPKMSTVKPVPAKKKHNDNGNCDNLLKQKFNPQKPNLVWVSDITYVKVGGRFCYICIIIDLFSRKVISYKSSSKINTKLVLDTFYSACSKRNFPENVMFHSDRGCQYTSKEFRQALDNNGFIQSFSAKGHPYDNAVAESFFKYLKKEELNRKTFSSIDELNLSLFEYIESFYNKRRPHSANNFLSPDQKENNFIKY